MLVRKELDSTFKNIENNSLILLNFRAVLFNFDNNSLKISLPAASRDIFHYVSEYMRISINYSMFSIVLKKVKMTSTRKKKEPTQSQLLIYNLFVE